MDVADWLKQLGLEKYAPAFRENSVDCATLPRLTPEDLKELGVAAVGHRRVLLDAISRMVDVAALDAVAALERDRRQVSVLFADMVGYTKLSTELDAEDVRALLDRFFDVADRAISVHGGSVDKHIGDCVMGVFGAPVAHDDDPLRAAFAALAIRDDLKSVGEGIGHAIDVHMGVSSGEVVAGAVSESGNEYTVTGEAVNTAARLAARARAGEILVSASVHEAARNAVEFEPGDLLELKGAAGLVPTWRARRTRASRVEPMRPLVGRSAEVRQLKAALESCAAGLGQTIHLRGEAGIGKSRLAEEVRRLAAEKGFAVRLGLVFDFGGDNGRSALAELARASIGDVLQADAARPAESAATALQTAGFMAMEVAVLLDLAGQELDLRFRQLFDAMDNETRAARAGTAFRRLIEDSSRKHPLLLVVEDLHWADATTLDLLSRISAGIRDLPALLLVTARADGDLLGRRWSPSPPFLTIDLGALSPDEAAALARCYDGIDAANSDACIRRAAGNPLFLDQLFRHAQTEAGGAVPGSVRSLVQARMDRLPPPARLALQVAAVLGHIFSADDLCFLLDESEFDIDVLVQRNLVLPHESGFIFTHALIRDAAYETLLRRRRRELHLRAGKRFLESNPAAAAEHLVAGGDAAASQACLRAATDLIAGYRYEPALRLIGQGLGCADRPDERADLLLLRGDAHLGTGRAGKAETDYCEALAVASGPHRQCLARLGLASARRITDDIERALADVDFVIEMARGGGLDEEAARAFGLRGNLLFPSGDVEGAMAAHMRSLEFARKVGSAEFEASALGGLGDVEYMRGRLASAHARFSDCVAMSRAHGLRRTEAANLPMQAITGLWRGDARQTLELANAAVEAAAAIGNERALIIAHHAAYFACRLLTRADGALRHAAEAFQLARKLKAPRFEAEALAFEAQVHADRKRRPEARRLFEEALAIARRTGMAYMGPVFLGGLAQTAETEAARAAAVDEAEALLATGSMCHNHLMFRREMIDLCLDTGDRAGAERHAVRLDEYLRPEPVPMAAFIIRRARLLARPDPGDAGWVADLEALAAEANGMGDLLALGAINRLLGRRSRDPAAQPISS